MALNLQTELARRTPFQVIRQRVQGMNKPPIPKRFTAPPGASQSATDPYLAKAQAQLMALIQPQLQTLTQQQQQEEAKARAQSQVSLQAQLDAAQKAIPEMQSTYNTAVTGAGNIEEALRKTLAGQGSEASVNLGNLLTRIGAPGVSTRPDQPGSTALNQTYTGAEGAGLGMGGSAINRLLGTSANEVGYLTKQPAIYAGNAAGSLATALGDLGTKYSGLKSTLTNALPGQELSYAQSLRSRADSLKAQAANRTFQAEQAAQNRIQQALDRQAKEKLAVMALGDKNALAALDRKQKYELAQIAAQNRVDLANVNAQNKADLAGIEQGYTQANIAAKGAQARQTKQTKGYSGTGSSGTTIHDREKPAKTQAAVNKSVFIQAGDTYYDPVAGKNVPYTSAQIGKIRKRFEDAPTWKPLIQAINNALVAAGVQPLSPLGIRVRSTTLKKLGITPGPKGNPSTPKYNKTHGK